MATNGRLSALFVTLITKTATACRRGSNTVHLYYLFHPAVSSSHLELICATVHIIRIVSSLFCDSKSRHCHFIHVSDREHEDQMIHSQTAGSAGCGAGFCHWVAAVNTDKDNDSFSSDSCENTTFLIYMTTTKPFNVNDKLLCP